MKSIQHVFYYHFVYAAISHTIWGGPLFESSSDSIILTDLFRSFRKALQGNVEIALPLGHDASF
jgi:hypothetical protein